jgi:hypothetical protein
MGDTQVEELFESEQVHLFKDGVYTEACRLMCYKLLIGGMALSKVQDTLRVILHLVGKKVPPRATPPSPPSLSPPLPPSLRHSLPPPSPPPSPPPPPPPFPPPPGMHGPTCIFWANLTLHRRRRPATSVRKMSS